MVKADSNGLESHWEMFLFLKWQNHIKNKKLGDGEHFDHYFPGAHILSAAPPNTK